MKSSRIRIVNFTNFESLDIKASYQMLGIS